MKPERSVVHSLTIPQFLPQAVFINDILQGLNKSELEKLMHIHGDLVDKVKNTVHEWPLTPSGTAAALTFRGDIYSSLSAAK